MSFLSQLGWRYATKKFDTTRSVEQEKLDQILEAIRMTPTSFGSHLLHITVVTDPALKQKLLGASRNQIQVTTASHVLVLSARTDVFARKEAMFTALSGGSAEVRKKLAGFEKIYTLFLWFRTLTMTKKTWAQKQVYIALGFAHAACAELGVDSCPMEGFFPHQYSKILGLPAHIVPTLVLPIGYRATDESPHPKFRFPMSEIVEYR